MAQIYEVFLIGSAIIANPFPSLQHTLARHTAPVHAQRKHARWEQTYWGILHPHPRATVLQNLVPATPGLRSQIPLSTFFKLGPDRLAVVSITQKNLLHWIQNYVQVGEFSIPAGALKVGAQ